MAQRANVQDVEALRRLRVQIIKFAEQVGTAVSDAAAEVQGTLRWLELEQTLYWRNEQRKRHNELQRALDKLREKQLFKSPTGGQQSYVDEQKYVQKCKRLV